MQAVIPGCSAPWQRITKLNVSLFKKNDAGIEICISPRDAKGHILPLRGELEVMLWINNNPREGSMSYGNQPSQQWSGILIEEKSYDLRTGALVFLPYQEFQPPPQLFCEVQFTLTYEENTVSDVESGWDLGITD